MNWGPPLLGNTGGSFHGATNMTVTADDLPDLSGTTDLSYAFHGASALQQLPHLEDWDLTKPSFRLLTTTRF